MAAEPIERAHRRRGGGLGDEDMAPHRIDWNIDPGHRPHLACVPPGGVDDDRRGDGAGAGLDAGDASSRDCDRGDLGLALDPDAGRLSRLREAHGDAVRVGDAVASTVARREDAVDVEPWSQPDGVVRCEELDVDTQPSLHLNVGLEQLDRLGCGQQKQIAVLVGEPLHESDRLDGELHVLFGGELMAHAARVTPSRARGELRFTLEEDDIRHAASGEMVGGARTHTPPTDDDDVGCSTHPIRAWSPRVSPFAHISTGLAG